MAMNKLSISLFAPGIEAFPTYVDARVLAANIAKQHTVPAGAAFVKFAAEMPFYVLGGDNPIAAIPADVTDGTASVVNPTWMDVAGVAKISLIARISGVVTMSFYVPC